MTTTIRGSDNFDTSVINDTDWITVNGNFLNGWVNYNNGYTPARYRKLNGVVYIEGLVKSGTIGENVFILPADFRPSKTLILTGMAGSVIARFDIKSDGGVRTGGGSNSYFSITCSFSVS